MNRGSPFNEPRRNDKPDALTERELAFVEAMIDGAPSPAAAAARAGWPEGPYASTVGNSLARRADLAEMIRVGQLRRIDTAAQASGITLADVVNRLAEIGMRDPAGFYDERGRPRPIDELPPGLRASIEGIDVEEIKERGVTVGEVKKYKLAKPTVALDMLMRHLGGYELDNRQTLDPLADLLREISGRRGRSMIGPKE